MYLRIPNLTTMKIFFLLPVISLLTNSSHTGFSTAVQTDTTIVVHILDGNITEWPEQKFLTDKETKIRYAVDNDDQMLFLAMSISDKKEQQRIMQQGMSLFIDIKGKKKGNRGVQFPLGMENGVSIENMKVFGFSDGESFPQNVKTEGTINIAAAWDSSYAMNIEYSVPLKMLQASATELNNKKISIGWKINEVDLTSANTTQPVNTTSRVVTVVRPGNTRPLANNPNSGPTRRDPSPQSNAGRAQLIWTTHTINF